MTTVGIISDTHSCWNDRYAAHFADCQEIWHAGDIGDADIIQRFRGICPVVRAVCGNIDHGPVRRLCPERLVFETEGIRVLLTHIGGYPGKYAPGLRQTLIQERIRLMVCGHSHILKVIPDRTLDMLHINPGAAGYHGWQKERTLIKLTLDAGTFKELQVIELGKHSIK